METKDEKAFKKIIETTLCDLIEIARSKELREIRVEAGELAIGIKRPSPGEADTQARTIPKEEEDRVTSIVTNLVGIFHRSSDPFEPPLLDRGDPVSAGQVIGYVESMGLLHEIRSVCSGTVKDFLVKENESVQYGQSVVQVIHHG